VWLVAVHQSCIVLGVLYRCETWYLGIHVKEGRRQDENYTVLVRKSEERMSFGRHIDMER
jgi:hypothetical protein